MSRNNHDKNTIVKELKPGISTVSTKERERRENYQS